MGHGHYRSESENRAVRKTPAESLPAGGGPRRHHPAEDTRQYIRPLQALAEDEREYLLPRALQAALQRFGSTADIQDVSSAIREVCETESDRLDSELSMIRYVIWAIPSIGFIGTVRGIGEALGQAHRAVEGDIVGVTVSLGVAFNSTFIAPESSVFSSCS